MSFSCLQILVVWCFCSASCTTNHTRSICVSYILDGMNDSSSFQIDANKTAWLHDQAAKVTSHSVMWACIAVSLKFPGKLCFCFQHLWESSRSGLVSRSLSETSDPSTVLGVGFFTRLGSASEPRTSSCFEHWHVIVFRFLDSSRCPDAATIHPGSAPQDILCGCFNLRLYRLQHVTPRKAIRLVG